MGKFNTYRYLELKDDTSPSPPHINARSRSLKQPRRLRKIFILLVFVVLCVTYFTGIFASQSRFIDGLAKSLGYQNDYHYAIVIDAGSSGSRVLGYKFRVPFTVFGQANLDLVEEYWEQSKPGLSSFADDPEKGANSIVQLIQKASPLVPAASRSRTPLIVRATAGLRLLPTEKADNLVNHVRDAISKLGYDVGTNSVEIMEGSDEGIFIWYTVNLLHDLMSGGVTMAALDLGGGSTQITYQLDDDSVPVLDSDRYAVPTGAYNISVYTHSYLNLGLYAARYGFLRLEAGDTNTTRFMSVCVDPIVQGERWTYANKEFTIGGAPRRFLKRPDVYKACHDLIKRYVLRTLDYVPTEPPKGSVAAMSFFYEVAADAGIIDVMKGGSVTISQYRAAALTACSAQNIEQPYACADLVFIVTLLQDAYKMKDTDRVSLLKKVNGHEVSWALGLAYTTIMNRINVRS